MKVVIDTNVVISGCFFNGPSKQVVRAVVDGRANAAASPDILDEYLEVVDDMMERKARKYASKYRGDIFHAFTAKLDIEEPKREVSVCRDPDDDKFLECAIEAKALYIISGDSDLLDLESFEGVEIITAAQFCSRYLAEE